MSLTKRIKGFHYIENRTEKQCYILLISTVFTFYVPDCTGFVWVQMYK